MWGTKMKWILLLTLFSEAGDFWYVVDTDLTGEQCVARLEEVYDDAGNLFVAGDYELSCQLEGAE